MSYESSFHIVSLVHGLLSSLTVKRYMYERPVHGTEVEFVVINALPINADVMQTCHVNVNYHVKDLAPGVPDHTKLKAGSDAVIAILQKVSTTTYLVDFEGQSTMKEQGMDEHFSNLKFVVKNVNY